MKGKLEMFGDASCYTSVKLSGIEAELVLKNFCPLTNTMLSLLLLNEHHLQLQDEQYLLVKCWTWFKAGGGLLSFISLCRRNACHLRWRHVLSCYNSMYPVSSSHICFVLGKSREGEAGRQHCKGCHCKRSGCLKNYCECYEVSWWHFWCTLKLFVLTNIQFTWYLLVLYSVCNVHV